MVLFNYCNMNICNFQCLSFIWHTNKTESCFTHSNKLICFRKTICCRYDKMTPLYKSTLSPVAPGYIFHLAARESTGHPLLEALVPFPGRPLNDRCLAGSQTQPWRSPHSLWLNRCPFFLTAFLSVSICQPCIISQQSTVPLTAAIVNDIF